MTTDDSAINSSSGGAPVTAHDQGAALMRLGRFPEAAQALRRAVELDPTDEGSWRLLGGALASQGDSAGAVAAFERAAQLAPSSAKNQYNLAVALQNTDRLYEAKTRLEQALALDPDYDQARNLLDELVRQGETRGYGVPPPTGGGDAPAVPPSYAPPPPAYTPARPAAANSGGGDDLTPVGGPAYADTSVQGPAGGLYGGASSGGNDLASVGGGTSGATSQGAPPPPSAYPMAPPGHAPLPLLGAGGGAVQVNANGVLILVFGILSIVCCGILGPVAWIMGNQSLKMLDQPMVDQSERGIVNGGRICGIVGTVFMVLGIVYYVVVLGLGLSGALGK